MDVSAERFLSYKQTKERTSLSRWSILRMQKRGEFPPAYQLGLKRKGFRASDIDAWMKAKLEAVS